MAVPVQCEQCDAKYLIEDKFAGKRAKCKRCGHVMSIPLPSGPGGGIALTNDDTDDRGATIEPGPWGGPPPEPMHQGVTSQPPRGWRPQDVVVEREGAVEAFAVEGPARRPRGEQRPLGRTMDGLVPILLLTYAGVLAFLAWRNASLAETRYPAEVIEAAGGWLKAYFWGNMGLAFLGLFVIVGPLVLAGVAVGLKLRNYPLPGSLYLRACALGAIAGIFIILLFASQAQSFQGNNALVGLGIIVAAAGGYFAARFMLGIDWVTALICFLLGGILGTVGMVGNVFGSLRASQAMFMENVQKAVASGRRQQSTRPPVAVGPTYTPPAPTTPAPAPSVPPPAAPPSGTPSRIAPTPADPSPLVRTNPSPGERQSPVAGVPNDTGGDGLEGAAETIKTPGGPRPGGPGGRPQVNVQDVVARVKEAAGPIVADASVIPLESDVVAIVRPLSPSQAFAVVRNINREEVVEVYTGSPPTRAVQFPPFKAEAFGAANYALSADGQRLARVSTFPKLSLRVMSVKEGVEVAAMDLNTDNGNPTLLGFITPDRVLVRWQKSFQYALEVEDLRTKRRGRGFLLPDFDPSPANGAVSPDGRLFATAARETKLERGKGYVSRSYLMLHNLTEGVGPRKLPINSLDPKWAIRPAGLAFSPDGTRVAALFVQDGNAFVAVWNARTGAALPDVTPPGTFKPLDVVHGAAVGRGAFGSAPSLDWVPGGNALLVCGTSVVDVSNGALLADLGAMNLFEQAVTGDGAVHLGFTDSATLGKPAGIISLTFDPKKLPATKPAGPGGAAPPRKPAPAAGASPAPVR